MSPAAPGRTVTERVDRETFPWLYHDRDGWSPGFVMLRDGTAVAACFSSRIGAEAHEAGVA